MSLKPKTSNFIGSSIPSHIRDSNPLFVKFFEHYYKWMEQDGHPLNVIQNIVEYNDIDETSGVFATALINSLSTIIPSSATINKKTLVKNIKKFLLGKGSEESFKFIMNALFNETVEINWARDKVFRASNNEYTHTSNISVVSDAAFSDVDGCVITQLDPYAKGEIETCVSNNINGVTVNFITLNHKTVVGTFTEYASVKILKKSVSRTYSEVNEYYNALGISGSNLYINNQHVFNPSYIGKIVVQENTNFRAVVSTINSAQNLNVTNMTGTFVAGNDVYFVFPTDENTVYDKTDFLYGTVSPCVQTIDVSNPGAGYTVGQRLDFENGSGANVSAHISKLKTGGITDVIILSPGRGHSVGDQLKVNSAEDNTASLIVESIDGIGADVSFVMELENLSFKSACAGLSVNDVLTVTDGTGIESIKITVDSVTSSGDISSWTITNRGSYSICPNAWDNQLKLVTSVNLLEDNTSLPLSSDDNSGLLIENVVCLVDLKFRVKSSQIENTGHYYTAMTATAVGGLGTEAQFAVSIKDGVVTNIDVPSGGTDYVNATVVAITGSGVGLIVNPIIVGGVINSFIIVDGGSGYSASDTYVIVGDNGLGTDATLGTVSVLNEVVKKIVVIHPGHDYAYDTIVTMSGTGSGMGCSLSPVIVSGKISSVDVVSGGSGYTPANYTVQASAPTSSVLTPVLGTTGKVVGASVINGGIGYSDVTPLSLNITTSTGSGAVIIPELENGTLKHVNVVKGGSGYISTDPVVVANGGGTSAACKIEVDSVSGCVIFVHVTAAGTGYSYGTKGYVIGDGTGADITLNVDSSIKDVAVVSGGNSYLDNTTLTITDPNVAAAGAEMYPVISNGVIVGVNIINGGTGYTTPTITINGVGSGANLVCRVDRNISSVTMVSNGTDYYSAYILVQGDGSGAQCTPIIDKFGTLKSISQTAGSGYTSTPLFSAVDNSGQGAVSSVKILDPGYRFTKFVPMTLSVSSDAQFLSSTAHFIGIGDAIGGIGEIEFDNFGTQYDDLPDVMFPITVVVANNGNFSLGETVRVYGSDYVDGRTYNLLEEDLGDIITGIEGDRLIYEFDVQPINGVELKLSNIDFGSNTMTFNSTHMHLSVVSESGHNIVSESDLNVVYESSINIPIGSVLVGVTSGARSTITDIFQAEGFAKQGGNGNNNKKFLDVVGLLNSKLSRLNNNDNIQDFAYSIKSSVSRDEFAPYILPSVHPAGYKMFSELEHIMTNGVSIRPVASNKLSTVMTVIMSLYSLEKMVAFNTYELVSLKFIEDNKFRMNAFDYGYILMHDISSDQDVSLLTELGENLCGSDLMTKYPGKDVSYFADYEFSDFDDTTSFYNTPTISIDCACEIDIKTI